MKIGLLGVTFHSANKGCEALAYSFMEIMNDVAAQSNKIIEIFIIQNFPFHLYVKNKFSMEKVRSFLLPRQGYSHLTTRCIMLMHTSNQTFFNKKIASMDYVIDFTAGDSFSDIYGLSRFYNRTNFKYKIIKHGIPLILGSQTIGPFENSDAKKLASSVLNKCSIVFARDNLSYQCVKEISICNPKLTTDVAFALPYEKCEVGKTGKMKVGFNPSGLLWNGGYTGNNQFNLSVDYQGYCKSLIQKLLEEKKYEVHLIPHAFYQSIDITKDNDIIPIEELHRIYPDTIVAPSFDSCIDAKSYIAAMDVFTGARMHATIAAYSAKVPVIPFSYSRKFEGLFDELKYNHVLNGRNLSTEEAVRFTLKCICHKDILLDEIKRGHEYVNAKLNIFRDEMYKIINKQKE